MMQADKIKDRTDKIKDRTDKPKISNIHIAMVTILIGSMFAISVNYALAGVGNPLPDDVTNLANNSYRYNYINWVPMPTNTPTPTNNMYYVSPNGNDNNPGTQTQPFATIQKGISVSSPSGGDTVRVLSGTYYQTSTTGKVVINKPVNVIGSGKLNTIIDGSQITNYADKWKEGLVEITGNNVLFQGFTVQNAINSDGSSGSAGIVIASNNNIVEKNLIQNTFDSGIKLYGSSTNWAYGYSTKALNNTIRYNELYHVVWGGSPTVDRQEALSIVSADTFYIYYNYIHETGLFSLLHGAEGIDAKDGVNKGTIHHNYVYKALFTGIYCDGYNNGCSNIEIYNNIVENTTRGSDDAANRGDGIDANSERYGTTNQINIHDNIIHNTHNGYTVCNYHHSNSAPGIISNVTLNKNIAYIDDPSIPISDWYDLNVQNCGDILSNISVTNNYVYKISIDSAVSGAVTLSGNNQNLTDIANQFNAKYSNLKGDILAHVNSFRFIAFADTKDGSSITAAESQSIIRNGLNPNFVIFPGDLCPDTNCFATTWKYDINGDITGKTNNGLFNKTFATRGNHDLISISDWQSAFDFAGVASRIGATNYTEQTNDMTYSFDYSNSHFIGLDVLDVSAISPSQITWLDKDLTAAESRGLTHAFLFWHGPIYYVDGHPSTPPSSLITVLNKHSIVSAAFFGHEHVVTYTHINGSRISTITHPFEEFVSGGAGAELYDTNVSRVDYCIGKSGLSCPKLYGYMSVDVSGNNFNVSFYNMNSTLDKFLIFKK